MVVVSSFTLWLVDDPIKYFLFVFQVILTAAFFWLFISPKFEMPKLPNSKLGINLFSSLRISHLDYLFLFSSVSLLVANIVNIFTPVNILLAFIVISLFPGYLILRLTGIFNKVSILGGSSYLTCLVWHFPVLFPLCSHP